MTSEFMLTGGRSTFEVLRIENTVHRSMGPNPQFIHKLLTLLEEKSYPYAPKFLGIDDKGREVLTYIDGCVPRGGHAWSEAQLLKVVKIMRALHDATDGSDLAGKSEVVCHHDIAPWNTIMDGVIPVALFRLT